MSSRSASMPRPMRASAAGSDGSDCMFSMIWRVHARLTMDVWRAWSTFTCQAMWASAASQMASMTSMKPIRRRRSSDFGGDTLAVAVMAHHVADAAHGADVAVADLLAQVRDMHVQ